jgi:hypothetical protein
MGGQIIKDTRGCWTLRPTSSGDQYARDAQAQESGGQHTGPTANREDVG